MIPYNGQLKDFDYDIETHKSHHKNKNGVYKVTKYCNNIFTFDIECSSAWLENGKVIGYRKGETNDYWNNLQSLSLCYIWQFSCDGVVYYGRELRDFINVLDDLPKDANIIIWVHNLSYEFMFLSNILTWFKVFARSPHKPMKASSKEYPNIEFRCSYFLTRLSLDAWGKQLGVKKAVGDLDYDILRTPLTPLTEKELHYCEQDCLVVEAGIRDYCKTYISQHKIPLTQTGTVRKVVKEMLTADSNYVKFIKKLVPHDAKEYKRLQQVFAGGYTHANQLYAGKLIDEHIEHYDFASSYPTVMVAEKYPMSPWYYNGDNTMPDIKEFEDTAFIFLLKFSQLNSISFNTYIQASKVKGKGFEFDNGRILHADELEMYVTEQDYLTIMNNYEWESMEVIRIWRSRKDYLPREFTNYILELYANKTELKDVSGKEDLYLQSKQYINSMFGMCVTAIVQASVELEGDEWYMQPLTEEVVNHKLQQLAHYNPREKRYFLSYSWGCWVTAYARRNLWKCIESCDREVLYCDTDSIFVRGKHDFTWYNDEITQKLKTACEVNNLDFNKTRPCTPKGKQKPLGVFDREDDCIQFKTLGAKRYVERRVDGSLHLTVSGINKNAVELLNDDINNFKDGFNFDKDADCVTKKLCTYLDNMPTCTYPDGYVSTYTHGINLRRTGYLLSITDEYNNLIKYMNYDINDLPESIVNHLRGTW